MENTFKNQTAIVTGAAIGIGRATAVEFAKCGANVVIIDYNEQQLKSVEKEINALSTGKVRAYVCDVSDENRVEEVCAQIINEFKKIDILVNNAGIWRSNNGAFAQSESQNWKRKIDINILGTMYFTRAVIGNMIANNYGRIINLGSVAGVYGNGNMADYSMTKGAVIAFTKALSKEVAANQITVNAVSPGNVKDSEDAADSTELSYMAKSGTPDEIADLILFLASKKARFISGQNYIIDGIRKKV